jgi:hypothetical protein
MKRIWIGLLAVLALALPVPGAHAAAGDPLFVLQPKPLPFETAPFKPPPVGFFEGPCGLAVDSSARIYISDYYHDVVDVYSTGGVYSTQIVGVDPADGPCGLALDSGNRVYVNDFHRSVIRYGAVPNPGSGTLMGAADSEGNLPTGVAVSSTDDLLINMRKYVRFIDPTGSDGAPIGEGSLEDGYGVAISGYPGTNFHVYVPDAGTDTIKVYDPLADPDDVIDEIDGSETPPGKFVSLRDAAIAVDDETGEIYVVDDLTPEYKEGHEGVVYVFAPDGKYKGRLKYSVQLALPAGLAVDNSGKSTQGRVYVTSGYTELGAVFAYAPDSEGSAAVPLSLSTPGAIKGATEGGSAAAADTTAISSSAPASGASQPASPEAARQTGKKRPLDVSGRPGTAVVQKGNVRVKVSGQLSPKKLPRKGAAPISVSVGGDITTTDQSPPPRLLDLSIALNRNGRIDSTGLPVCPYDSLEPASSKRALSACRSALVGRGTFDAEIALPGQQPYPAQGQMLAFNGRSHGKPVLFGHIYSPHPFANSFVIVFQIKHLKRGTFGTELVARLPRSLVSWGKLTGIELNLDRRYTYKGQRRSYVSAGCPAPKGSHGAPFSLARTSFGFEGGRRLDGTLIGTCTPRG